MKDSGIKLIDIAVDVVTETEKAYGIRDESKVGHLIWLPKSQCEDNEDGTFTMPEWLAKGKGLI